MFEKVNPSHPDKIADRIAGAIVDLAYQKNTNPKVAVEVLIGHGHCHIINETSEYFETSEINAIVSRIAGKDIIVDYAEYKQDMNLAKNQEDQLRCGDNGIFIGNPLTKDEIELTHLAKVLYFQYNSDGKYIIDGTRKIICQSNANIADINAIFDNAIVNPLGYWTGGISVDTGATNRKLGSDMGRSVTGGGLHGKDLSKADVSINIYLHLLTNRLNKTVRVSCAIGDTTINVYHGYELIEETSYDKIVEKAKEYIDSIGGFEKFAEWGLIR